MPTETVDITNLGIDYSTAYEFEQILRNHSRCEEMVHKAYAEANREVNDRIVEMEMTITAATQIELEKFKTTKGRDYPISTISDLRKEVSFSNETCLAKRRALNEALERRDYLQGLVRAWNSRSHRLTELSDIVKRSLGGTFRVLDEDFTIDKFT